MMNEFEFCGSFTVASHFLWGKWNHIHMVSVFITERKGGVVIFSVHPDFTS